MAIFMAHFILNSYAQWGQNLFELEFLFLRRCGCTQRQRHQSLLVIKCLGKKHLQLQKPFEHIVSSLTKPYFIFHIPVWLATTLWFWNSNKRINKEIFHICDKNNQRMLLDNDSQSRLGKNNWKQKELYLRST